ncbi:hypothetical protein CPB84DRAFT_1770624 [Gymnopilus junonius]|uniref:MINDY deubiquitinase domain-containing protein n=1 Tax=Gymnopilus junonius TaxID=109634 RepID=A0A9P5TPS2_GYMJU|nr:hypothetical protein CPB84DRAFT_1770624 [Gymnopilus junonius]
MPLTQKGMDLNPDFTAATSFHPSDASAGGELKLFEQVNIPLLHGWLVDPASPEAAVLRRIHTYDTAVNLIAESAPHLHDTEGEATSPTREWSQEELKKVQDATVVRRFLDSTQSQLTYHGLFHLASTLPPNTPCALFRNSHLSVLYKYSPSASSSSYPSAASSSSQLQPSASSSRGAPPTDNMDMEDAAIYSLVTDQVFLNEPSVVWERTEDIDGGWSTFVDSDFVKSSQTAEEASVLRKLRRMKIWDCRSNEEEHNARRQHEAYLQEQQRRSRRQDSCLPTTDKKKKGDCLIM